VEEEQKGGEGKRREGKRGVKRGEGKEAQTPSSIWIRGWERNGKEGKGKEGREKRE